MPKVFSFDIFDTCITRMHAYPRDLFFDLGLRLAPASASQSARRAFAKRFQRMRIYAEKIAHWRARRSGYDHADIHAIYRNFSGLMRQSLSEDQLVAAELKLEEESIYPISENLERLESLRAAGHRIVFISDMYIPGRLLGPMLMNKGVMKKGDGLYVSCDVGSSKHTGRLFDDVLAQERLRGGEVFHIGDNLHADIRMAEARGIHTEHFTTAHLLRQEVIIAGPCIPRGPAASWQAAFSRRCRLVTRHELSSQAMHPLDGVIFAIVIPFLLAYVQWILNDAHKRGIKRLYFVARDGEVLFKIAKSLNPQSIELKYLYGSRRAWLAPSIVDKQFEWKRLLAVTGNASAPLDIASRAGLDEIAQFKIRAAFDMDEKKWSRPLDLDEANIFIEKLFENSVSAEILHISTHHKREAALMYFRQEGLLSDSPWALVDSGWSLNSQAALKRILDNADEKYQTPKGYYLGLALDHLQEAQAGKAYSFVKKAGSIFSRRRVIVEHCFLPATHPSTQGYKSGGQKAVPEFSNEARGSIDMNYAMRLHALATQAASMVANDPELNKSVQYFSDEIRDVASNFICNPDKADAMEMSYFTVTADMRQEQKFSTPLCCPLSLKDVWRIFSMAISPKKKFSSSAWMWLEGSAAISSYSIRLMIRSLLWLDRMKNNLGLKK